MTGKDLDWWTYHRVSKVVLGVLNETIDKLTRGLYDLDVLSTYLRNLGYDKKVPCTTDFEGVEEARQMLTVLRGRLLAGAARWETTGEQSA